jgi:hypothetical protein
MEELKREKRFASSANLKEFKEYVPSRSYLRIPEPIPSFNDFTNNANATAKAETKEYSGDYVTGLATLHKSNIVPVGKDDNPVDYATMRRN